MKGFIIFLLILWVLWFFRARIQVWLLGHILRRVQERMGGDGAGDYSRQQRTSSRGSGRGSSAGSASQQKQELDDIEARKFERAASDEYVDFEELPKE
ncbi:hypothetical protein HMPREF9134_01706 [Porphyromonas catoniae F0037]|jgi:hypothetical protein|uniref:DUF4834 family protein n=1 Tax=Porphyromonas catoniae F0037 TaxID=1127696 RepID=L1NB11_9PORP|nr:DUF4834 family protein [Porphyromonas catoniae]EKY00372.1 hypothetical protein HMPREF9134_01706 [Porphyromonas catoniae F0037]